MRFGVYHPSQQEKLPTLAPPRQAPFAAAALLPSKYARLKPSLVPWMRVGAFFFFLFFFCREAARAVMPPLSDEQV
mgnify:CR=1 FL=1